MLPRLKSKQPAGQIIAVFIQGKSHVVTKHWKNTGAVDATLTLCGKRIVLESQRSGLARECLECQRLKAEHDTRRRADLDHLQGGN